jgi:hypothetical protein
MIMPNILIETLLWQFELTWRLASDFHLPHLTDENSLWEPVPGSWNVRCLANGKWTHDWADVEPSPAPAVTIGWITWQMIWWWSGLIAASKGQKPASHERVIWPGSAEAACRQLQALAREWSGILSGLNDLDLERPVVYLWPEPRPLRLVAAWANSELMKNIAEIGIIRHQFETSRVKAREE